MKAKLFYLYSLTIILSCTIIDNDNSIVSQELYRIHVNEKFGFINEKGKLVIEPQFDNAFLVFSDSVCYAEIGEKHGLINTKGEFILDLSSDINCVYMYDKKLQVAIFLANNGRMGLINTSGDIILPAIYKVITYDVYGYIVEDTLGNMGYVNSNGEFVVPCKYDAVNGYHEGLMVVATSRKCGYVDTMGIWVIDSIYDDARAFGNGFARVKANQKWKFINRSGKIIEKLNYDDVLSGFTSNRAFVRQGDKTLLIDTLGTIIAENCADSIYGFQNGYAIFQENGRYGLIDTLGNVIVRPVYEKLSDLHNGLSVFEKKGKRGVLDTLGNVIIGAHHNFIVNNWPTLLVCQDISNNRELFSYYDKNGALIWKDLPGGDYILPEMPTKSDFKALLDSRLSELDPIEGVYYFTCNELAANRNGDYMPVNGSWSAFLAVLRKPHTDDFYAQIIDDKGSQTGWVKKFIKIGESNAYAIVDCDTSDNSESNQLKWSEDGKLILEDPYKFDILLRHGNDAYYNYYAKCEFVKDHPSSLEFEKVQKAEWLGTGFAIADGFVITNNHVITGAKSISVKTIDDDKKESYKGYVVAADREHDLAIIKILDKKFDGFDEIPYSFGKTMPEVGEEIFVLGYPMTETMGTELKVTDGIISAASGYKGDQSMYQISAAVQPGNSGGPLFDKEGNVIGVVCAKHADAENASYAIKISYLFSLINSSDLEIKLPEHNSIKSKSLSKKVKQVKPFVYLIECSSH